MSNILKPQHDPCNILRNSLRLLPPQASERILFHLSKTIHYEPVIGIMGKTGAGKSSLCNALFQQPVCLTHDLTACTREPQRLVLTVGERSMTLIDLPGVGEAPEYDEEYQLLYRSLLNELDLIIWVLRADDRARSTDIDTYRTLIEYGADPSRFLFVLTQADRVPPLPATSMSLPSPEQVISLAILSSQTAGQFPSSFPIMAVSSHTGYNLPALVELMAHALPGQASSAVYRQLKSEYKTAEAETAVRQAFGDIAGTAFDTVFNPDAYSPGWAVLLRRLRRKLVRLAERLWDRIFG
ncbi:GTPase [Citrobacter europaeus]|uniref:GTPase family protein n=1 Tax=Citrobacter europaeus TaxID=1914243 RepID=UPI000F4E2BCC|nr:GTPase [Citrobacter europaeus]ROW34644.1 GTPase [Citrobacter europaeus]